VGGGRILLTGLVFGLAPFVGNFVGNFVDIGRFDKVSDKVSDKGKQRAPSLRAMAGQSIRPGLVRDAARPGGSGIGSNQESAPIEP